MVLDRYIFRLWLGPFLASLFVVTGVLLLGRALKVLGMVVDSGVEWTVLVSMLAAIMPYFLVLTVPIAFFFAMQATIIRLHQESELDALRAAGISYFRLLRPLLAVAVVLWVAIGYTAMQWMPEGQKAFQGLLLAMQKMKAAPGFEPQRFNRDLEHFTIYVEGEDDLGRLHGFMLEDDRPGGRAVYVAEMAEIERVGGTLRFILYNGTRLEGNRGNLRALSFEEYQVGIDVGQLGLLHVPKWSTRIFEMGMKELWQQRQKDDSPAAVAEWHRRLLLPTIVFVLFLFALPISLEPKRSGRAGAYLLGVAVMLVVYNVSILLHQQVSHGNLPWWSMWLGQLLLATLGAELTRRAAMDRMPAWLAGFGESIYLIHQHLQSRIARRLGKA